jgi:hypothetical protein
MASFYRVILSRGQERLDFNAVLTAFGIIPVDGRIARHE